MHTSIGKTETKALVVSGSACIIINKSLAKRVVLNSLNTNASHETAYFSTLDLKYANSQLMLNPESSRHCNFNFDCGKFTGIYRFLAGFYGITDMPAAIQKVMDYKSFGVNNTSCFLDDVIVVSRGSKEDQLR